MKVTLLFLVCLASVVGGGALVHANPALPDRVTQAARDTAAFAQSEAQKVVQQPPQAPQASQTPQANAGGGGGAPTTGAPWSSDDCSWAESVLANDQQLDASTAQAIANGDHTWGTTPTYYQTWSDRWRTLLAQVQGWCSPAAIAITADQRSAAEQWFATSIGNHQSDTLARPQDATWNDQWISNYTRLAGLYAS